MLYKNGIGGNEVKLDANEAIQDIPQNRTLIAQKLTKDAPISPLAVKGLTSVEKVFEHFKPNLDVAFEDAEGGTKNENLAFKNVGDFGIKGITAKSDFLSTLNIEQEQYQKIIKQMKSNKILQAAIKDGDAKEDLIANLKNLIEQLDNVK